MNSVGMKRAKILRDSLIALGCEAEIMVQYNECVTVACGRTTAGNWLQFPGFYFDGSPVPFANGQIGSPWRYGAKRDVWEAACAA